MRFYDSSEQKAEFTRLALASLEQHGIAPDPAHFAIWYAYHSGKYPELRESLDNLLRHDIELSEERLDGIFAEHFGFDAAGTAFLEASGRIGTTVEQMLGLLGEAGRDASAYSDALTGLSDRISPGGQPGELAGLARAVIAETQKMVRRSRHLEQRLGQSSAEVRELRARLEQATREALTDPLTGFANRKFFDLCLKRDARAAAAEGGALTLIMSDIDHFKKFNDEFGHRVGDEVLRIVARTVREGVPAAATAARYGGEEFAIILPQTALDPALRLADQMRAHLASKQIVGRASGKTLGTITMSFGVAQYRRGEPLWELVQRADQALYAAKRDGRNQVVGEAAA
jgi:diguanylate cyclase